MRQKRSIASLGKSGGRKWNFRWNRGIEGSLLVGASSIFLLQYRALSDLVANTGSFELISQSRSNCYLIKMAGEELEVESSPRSLATRAFGADCGHVSGFPTDHVINSFISFTLHVVSFFIEFSIPSGEFQVTSHCSQKPMPLISLFICYSLLYCSSYWSGEKIVTSSRSLYESRA